ncbi:MULTISPECIES: oligopeptide ABC transporter permease [unclassified Planococcus (in: firmicutes)]|uniref:oligopeptide ABC transporter permease n=1 Tax=Planococcus TaxID=1372 RepID=UPI000C33BAA4|nr:MULTISPECIES: oligopeptide ABC transporter permease [unclassified Planococcus (in: firmicutes)]AUD14267.1 peptide ABC transporter permease [Planococcus sp. MB-3u-03]PKG48302.1 peptide ABC transporter permease [Planococcus sp. Urea-trap-24]PKG92149.1 peptide ABC transporter permease [Planococcus sp. Urea-3u-39]PKH42945.1 peptide ABC transporter permease [Planococcus sp. MB-3u-09]
MTQNYEKLPQDAFTRIPRDTQEAEKISKPSVSFWQDAWRSLKKNKGAIISLILFGLILIMSFVGPMISPYEPNDQTITHANLPPKMPVIENLGIMDGVGTLGGREVDLYEMKNVEQNYWFGTDGLGRDMFSRVWKGTQVSLFIAFVAAAIDMLIGVIYGGISGYFGGRIDDVMQRIVEILTGIPNLVVVILFILIMDPGILAIIIALTITGWTGMSRVVRGQVLKYKSQEFVLAARTLGASDSRIIWKHLMPNVLGVIIINTMFTIPGAIFFEAFLSFIGLGLQAPDASLGTLINDGYKLIQYQPHILLFPAVVLSLIMIAFNLIGDGLRDALDPKMKD